MNMVPSTVHATDFKKSFTVDCDASDYKIVGVLSQTFNGVKPPIAYLSR